MNIHLVQNSLNATYSPVPKIALCEGPVYFFRIQDPPGGILTLLPTNVAPQNSAVGRSHGVESFQNVDMALSFCMFSL